MIQFIEHNKDLLGLIAVVMGGVFVFVKWIDSRNRELKEKRYQNYMDLIGVISGKRKDSTTPNMTEQIAATYFLLEYKEYYSMTKKIFSSLDLKQISDERWGKHILPHIRTVLEEMNQT